MFEPLPTIVGRRLLFDLAGRTNYPVAQSLRALAVNPNPDYKRWKSFKLGKRPDKTVDSWTTDGRGRYLSLPRGLFQRSCQVLAELGYQPELELRTTFPPAEVLELATPLWQHQERLVATIDPDGEPFQDLLWRAPQGGGKTQAVLAAAAMLPTTALIVVPTENLFQQWLVRVEREFGFRPGRIGKGHREVRRITVAMQQTLAKCATELAPHFGLVAIDEVQKAAAPTVQHTIDKFPARFRIGVSADERRADKKEFLVHEQFGEVACEVQKAELLERGEIVPVEVRVVPTEFRADWWTALAPEDRGNERQRQESAQKKLLQRSRLLDEIAADEDRNQIAVGCALLALTQDEQVVLLTDRREHCHRLAAALASCSVKCGYFIGGSDYSNEFTLALAGMKSGELRAAAGTFQAVGVGFEAHRRLSHGVFAGPVAADDDSRMQWNQYCGRFARSAPGKTKGVVYYLWDRLVFGLKPLRLIKRWNRDTFVVGARGDLIPAKEFLRAHSK